jgi:HSP20 family protein
MFNLIPWKRRSAGHEPESLSERGSHSLASLRDDFDRLFERFWQEAQTWPSTARDWFAAGGGWGQAFEDRGDAYVLRANLPGFEAERFDVRVTGNQLVIRAEQEVKSEEEGTSSRHYGRVHRSVTLPDGVDKDRIEARYHSGVLEVHLPKTEQAKGKRITVAPGPPL